MQLFPIFVSNSKEILKWQLIIQTRIIRCNVDTSPGSVTWITRTNFGTKSTIETRRTSLVAIYATCPGPTFLDRENASILKELTILHLQKRENRWMSENIKRNFIYQHRNCQRLDNVDSTLKDFYNHNISKINFTNGNYFLLRRLSIVKCNIYIRLLTLQMNLNIFLTVLI